MSSKVQRFRKLVFANVPGLKTVLDAPRDPAGYWFIDLRNGKTTLTIEYRPDEGFGIHRDGSAFGEHPQEFYRRPELAARRAIQLLRPARKKVQRLTLKDLRELYDCSQVDLAKKVGVKQSAISRFEKRSEVKVGTLAAAVKALGGKLEIRAHFPDADVPLLIKE
jgi:DNA-binding XRE family transcriptional regulator